MGVREDTHIDAEGVLLIGANNAFFNEIFLFCPLGTYFFG